jgi:uncharacterized protein (TIRG00374 family)
MEHRPFRRYGVLAAKLVLAAALLLYLIHQAQQNESFARLVEQPKRWSLLAVAVGLVACIAVVSFFRWFLLVRALGLNFRVADAMRLGSLGYVLNLISLGTVGGDLFKAVLIAKGQPGKRTEAVATVVFDRIVGLYALLLVAAGGALLSDVRSRGAALAALCNATLAAAVVATIGLAILMVPAVTGARTESQLARKPLVGDTAARLLAAARAYRSQPLVVLVAVLLSILLHVMLTAAVVCIANGLPGAVPSWSDHFVLVPLSMVAGSIPITPSGLGTLELAMDTLYVVMGREQGVVQGTGTIVAFGYRVATMAVACVAALYYAGVSGRLPKLEGSEAK